MINLWRSRGDYLPVRASLLPRVGLEASDLGAV